MGLRFGLSVGTQAFHAPSFDLECLKTLAGLASIYYARC